MGEEGEEEGGEQPGEEVHFYEEVRLQALTITNGMHASLVLLTLYPKIESKRSCWVGRVVHCGLSNQSVFSVHDIMKKKVASTKAVKIIVEVASAAMFFALLKLTS